MKNNHVFYMQKCLQLAQKAEGRTSPNPMVGCVIVKNNRIISEGWHKKAGLPHAEAEALAKAGVRAKGASLYVNLEPCCHTDKRTPPCAQAIIKAGIKNVIAAMADPNPHVFGRGFSMLKNSRIKVTQGVLEEEAKYQNRIYLKNVGTHAPYIIVKAGISLDGKIALKNGVSKWITGPDSLKHSQVLRRQCDAILTGINTVLTDNPRLDCRIDKTKKIKKIILDSRGRIPLKAVLFKKSQPHDIFIFAPEIKAQKKKQLENAGLNVIKRKTLKQLMHELYSSGITSVLVEGGSSVFTSFLREKLVDEACFYMAPKIIGNDGIPFVKNFGFTNLEKTYTISNAQHTSLGTDVLIKGSIVY